MIEDYKKNKKTHEDPEIEAILSKYDTDGDGILEAEEVQALVENNKLSDTAARYAGLSIGLSRAFRYLAFTSDFGEALRPVISARIVTGTYMIAGGYCVAGLKKKNSYKICVIADIYIIRLF